MALLAGFPLSNTQSPVSGPRAVPLTLDFTGVTQVTRDFVQEEAQGILDFIQSVYVNNLANGGTVELQFAPLGYSILVKANEQGIWPVIATPQTRLLAISTAGFKVPLIFFNAETRYFRWGI